MAADVGQFNSLLGMGYRTPAATKADYGLSGFSNQSIGGVSEASITPAQVDVNNVKW